MTRIDEWPVRADDAAKVAGVDAIFLRHGTTFVPMRVQQYEAESVLQALIAEHPEILGEDETGEQSAWLLVKREAGIADTAEGSDRWSLDHLFLDRIGVPTLVEVKRATDTRARREVVAQMLEYAANGSAYWSVDLLRTWFEAECERQAVDPQARLEAFGVNDAEAYWETVKTNLAAERIRLVFVADEILPELRSILEFLNRQMSETEVFAIEVKQYVDAAGERQTIVPRVIGRTEAAKAAKSGGRRRTRQWDEQSLLDDIQRLAGDTAVVVARELIRWAGRRDDLTVNYGSGATWGSATVKLQKDRKVMLTAFHINSDGTLLFPFVYMKLQPPFESRQNRDELRRRISEAVPRAAIPAEEGRESPSIKLDTLTDEHTRLSLIAAFDWAFEQAREAHIGRA